MTSLSIIVPCYDEEAAIRSLIERLDDVVTDLAKSFDVEVICVDDGSRDATASVVGDCERERPWLRLVAHARNQGLGAAMRTGIEASSADYVAMLDADGTFAPEGLRGLVEKLDEGYDIVVGSAFHPEGSVESVHAFRLFVSRSLSALYRLLTGADVYSFSGIFRVYRREVFSAIDFSESGFSSVSEILLQALERRMRVAEVPATLSRRELGESKLQFWAEVGDHLKLIARCARMRLGESPEPYVRPSEPYREALPMDRGKSKG